MTGIVGLEYNGNRYYYKKNLQEDIIGILGSNNQQIVTYEYDSWGKVLSIKDSNGNIIEDNNHIGIINPFRYRSYYYDNETGLYYLNSRYYHPEWKRFINADEILGANQDLNSYNLYAYCSNNPIIQSDPSGHGLWKSIKKVIRKITNSFTKKKATTSKSKNVKVSLSKINTASGVSNSGNNKLPTVGKPNSVASNNKGDKRYYGEDGRATKDVDTSHPWRHPDLENPHEHDWVWGEDGSPTRGEAHNFSNAAIETVAIIGIAYLIYRGVRMLPSLIPTFWWTIPINVATP